MYKPKLKSWYKSDTHYFVITRDMAAAMWLSLGLTLVLISICIVVSSNSFLIHLLGVSTATAGVMTFIPAMDCCCYEASWTTHFLKRKQIR